MKRKYLIIAFLFFAICAFLVWARFVLAQQLHISATVVDGRFQQDEYFSGTSVENGTTYINDGYNLEVRGAGATIEETHTFGGGATLNINGHSYMGYISGHEDVNMSEVNLSSNPLNVGVAAGIQWQATEIQLETSASPGGTGECAGVNYNATGTVTGYIGAAYIDRRIGMLVVNETDAEGNVINTTTTEDRKSVV